MKEIDKANELVSEEQSEMDGAEFSTANLPSRKEIHGKKKQKTKVKIRFPFIKMLALFFVIVLGTVLAIATQMTKDGESAKTTTGKESEYAESIGEISGFDDEEEDAETEVVAEEAAAEENAEAETTEKETVVTVEETETEQVAEEVEATTTETTESTQQTVEKTEQTTSSTTTANGVTKHVVQANENLFRIALKYYSSAEGVEIIKQYNGLTNENIVVGDVLNIPPR